MINIRLCGVVRPRSASDFSVRGYARLFADSGVIEFRGRMTWLTLRETRLVATIAAVPSHGQRVAFVDLMWGEDEDGGPLDVEAAFANVIHKLNEKIRKIGLDVRHLGNKNGPLYIEESAE